MRVGIEIMRSHFDHVIVDLRHDLDAGTVAAAFSIFPIFVFYVVGIVSAGFHLGNGIFTFLITWGLAVGQRAQRIAQIISTATAIIVSAAGIAIAAYFVSLAGGFVWWFA